MRNLSTTGKNLENPLPTSLKPMRPNEKLNQAAQIQADYCAQMNQLTQDQPRNRSRFKVPDRLKEVGYHGQAWEAGGAGAPLAEYPTDWMKSETHYRPWWSLDAPNEDDVGFGVAKSTRRCPETELPFRDGKCHIEMA